MSSLAPTSSPASVLPENPLVPEGPYVGPRPFKSGESLFGRDREVRELFYALNSERVVLLHSPSGAGKSSLIQAGLIPRLRAEEFDVWPTIRVREEAPAGVNRYAFSTMVSLDEDLPEALRKDAAALGSLSLADYAASRPRRRGAPPNVVLIFDQFEEVLTLDPLGIKTKCAFFEQLGDVLRNRDFWALFAIREDYLAPLDPYAPYLPTQLKNRFRLDLLGEKASLAAIQEPARKFGRTFSASAASQLFKDLATVDVQQPDGSFESQTGQYAEPVQLQVVCKRLWEQLPDDVREIDETHLKKFADVTGALGSYYEAAVGDVAAGDRNRERDIREWFSDRLIVRGQIRGQVMKGADQGLDADVVEKLESAKHLIRAEKRRGATWYELSHDRLVRPVLQRNAAWFEKNLANFQRAASVWEKTGHPESLLLVGGDYAAAQQQSSAPGMAQTEIERRFLDASGIKQAALARAADQARRTRRFGYLSAALAAIATVAFVIALFETRDAKKAERDAKQAGTDATIAKIAADKNSRELAIAFNQLSDVQKKYEDLRRTNRDLPVPLQAGDGAPQPPQPPDKVFADLLSQPGSIRVADVIPAAAVPGPIKVLALGWAPLIGRPAQPFAVAREHSGPVKGRIVAVGHDGLLDYVNPNRDDLGKKNTFVQASLKWLQGGNAPVILMDTDPRETLMADRNKWVLLSGKFHEWGFRIIEETDLSNLDRLNQASVIVIENSGFLTPPEIDAVEKFVKRGGGLFITGLGWAWKYYPAPGVKGIPDTYPMNQLLRRFGAEFGEEYLERN